MKKILNLLLFIPLFALTGCAGPGKIMNGWIGKTKEQLFKTWGQPERVVENGAAGTILIYSATSYLYDSPGLDITTQGDGYTPLNHPAHKNAQFVKLKLFYINPAGVIYSWKMENI